jgi:hypothetical protein
MPFARHARRIKLFLQLIPVLIVAGAALYGAANLQQVKEFLASATGEPANLQVRTQNSLGPLPRPWQNLAQGGEMHDWNMGPIKGQVAALQPRYIRLDHLYSFYEIAQRDGNGQVTYNFSKLDAVVNEILEVGAKPYFSLSYMPTQLSADGSITGAPANYGEWQSLVRATIQHYSGTRGISDVMYEVWNEPDLFGGWKTYGDKNYLTLYWYAHLGQAQTSGTKPYKFGGPATTALYKNWFDALAKLKEEQGARLDFISWHHYSKDVDRFREDFALAKQWQSENPALATVELHLTEFGPDSEVDPSNDSSVGAAHLAAVATEMPGFVDRAFIFEIEDGKDPTGREFWGRWGLLTHRDFGNKIKPRYSAQRLLNRMEGEQLQVLGKGTWVKALASRSGSDILMIVANYDQYGRHAEDVPLTFTDIEPGEYKLEIFQLGGGTRNVNLSTSATTAATTLPMSPNSVVFLRLKKQ